MTTLKGNYDKKEIEGLGLEFPPLDPSFYLTRSEVDVVERWIKMAEDGLFINGLLTGHSGTGKTSLPYQIAAFTGRPLGFAAVGGMSEPRQLFGKIGFQQGRGTFFTPGIILNTISVPNSILVVDEINRVNDGSCHAHLHNLLDDRRLPFRYDDGDITIKIAPGVMIFATMNLGGEYTGTIDMDEALHDRFEYLQMDRLPKEAAERVVREKVGLDSVNTAKLVSLAYETEVGMRSILKSAKHLKYGAEFKEAIKTGFSLETSKLEKALGIQTMTQKVKVSNEEVIKWPRG